MIRRSIALLLIVHMLGLGGIPIAQADLIGTQAALNLEVQQAQRARVDAFLTRQEVQTHLLDLGVPPEAVTERLAALTDEELELIAQNIDTLPAGGNVLAVIGIVFVVLIILEVVGVTNIFSKL